MTNEEAIKTINNHHFLFASMPDDLLEALDMAIKSLEQPELQWIPCNNTIDIPDYEVLCCDKRGNELIGWLFYNNGQWICESKGEIMYGTIAWMPLPEPYEERREG